MTAYTPTTQERIEDKAQVYGFRVKESVFAEKSVLERWNCTLTVFFEYRDSHGGHTVTKGFKLESDWFQSFDKFELITKLIESFGREKDEQAS